MGRRTLRFNGVTGGSWDGDVPLLRPPTLSWGKLVSVEATMSQLIPSQPNLRQEVDSSLVTDA